MTSQERYQNDPVYHEMVDSFGELLKRTEFSPADLYAAVDLAVELSMPAVLFGTPPTADYVKAARLNLKGYESWK